MSKVIQFSDAKSDMLRDKVLSAYNLLDDDDISTERLLALVCDECQCDVTDVVRILTEEYGERNS